MVRQIETDVLIIGGGLAGLRAAQAVVQTGTDCVLLSKAPVGQAGASARASGGFAAATAKNDSPTRHLNDIRDGGYGLSQPHLSKLVSNTAAQALEQLDRSVHGFPRCEQGMLVGAEVPAHSMPRSVQYPNGMSHLLKRLKAELLEAGVQVCDEHRVLDWLTDETGQIRGLYVANVSTLETVKCFSKSVVLATGGCGQLFPVTSNGPDATGDGYALALKAGVRLRDMEFIQYTPTAFAVPEALRGQTIVGTLLKVPGVKLLNVHGERFMERHAPQELEGANRAVLARSIYREIVEGRGTDAGGVYLDATCMNADDFNLHRPGLYDTCISNGIDPTKEAIQTAPSAHTCLGGVVVDETLRAAPNLFCAGEVIGGTHGANRLSSNSLSEANVTGWLAGQNAAWNAKQRAASGVTTRPSYRRSPQLSGDARKLRQRIVDVMGKAAGIERSEVDLEDGLAQLGEVASRIEGRSEPGIGGAPDMEALDIQNMVLTGQAILNSANHRKESRGAHFRTDFPETDDAQWLGSVVTDLDGMQSKCSFEPLQEQMQSDEM